MVLLEANINAADIMRLIVSMGSHERSALLVCL